MMKFKAQIEIKDWDRYTKWASEWAINKVTRDAVTIARTLVPVDTGSLKRRITRTTATRNASGTVTTGTLTVESEGPFRYDYSKAVEYGSGIYSTYPGSLREPIRAKKPGGFLVFSVKEGVTQRRRLSAKSLEAGYMGATLHFVIPRSRTGKRATWRSMLAEEETKTLRSLDVEGRHVVFTKEVLGQRPKPFLRPAMDKAQEKLFPYFIRRLDKYFRSD